MIQSTMCGVLLSLRALQGLVSILYMLTLHLKQVLPTGVMDALGLTRFPAGVF
jgi:hypothetical protein